MKTTTTHIIALTAIAICVLAFSSCKKESLNPDSSNNKAAVEEVTNEVQNMAFGMHAMPVSFKTDNDGIMWGENTWAGDCATITHDELSNPKTITFDFGAGCLDDLGKVRTGKVVVTYNNSDFTLNGTYFIVSFQGFSVDGKQYEGTSTLRNVGFTVSRQPKYTLVIDCAMSTPALDSWTRINASYNGEWITGSSTPNTEEDDKLTMKGSATGADHKGMSFTLTIQTPLIKKKATGCSPFFIQGKTVMTKPNQPNEYLDYGSGACDNLAVQTVNGVSETIALQ